jgi:hypothetical protein
VQLSLDTIQESEPPELREERAQGVGGHRQRSR